MQAVRFMVLASLLAAAASMASAETGSGELRRAWVLARSSESMSGGTHVDPKRRDIIVYNLTCESGRLRHAEETYDVSEQLGSGSVWVVRHDGAETSGTLQRALDAVCRA